MFNGLQTSARDTGSQAGCLSSMVIKGMAPTGLSKETAGFIEKNKEKVRKLPKGGRTKMCEPWTVSL